MLARTRIAFFGLALVATLAVAPAGAKTSTHRSPSGPAILVSEGCAIGFADVPSERGCLGGPSPIAAPRSGDLEPCPGIPLVDDHCETWQSTYNGPASGFDTAGEGSEGGMGEVIDTSSDGSTVYTLGTSDGALGSERDPDLVTIATNAEDGSTRWTTRFPGPAETPAIWGMNVLADPDGDLVYSMGRGYPDGALCPSTTTVVAYRAATGAEAWNATRDAIEDRCTYVRAAAIDPGGERLFIVGADDGANGKATFSVVTRSADTGEVLWSDSYTGSDSQGAGASAVTTSPDGSIVYVAGSGLEDRSGLYAGVAWIVRAYNAATGAVIWEYRWPAPKPLSPFPANPPAAIVPSPDGTRLFMTGGAEGKTLFDIFTLGIDAATGTKLWEADHEGLRSMIKSSFDSVWYKGPLGVTRDGSKVFVSGYQTCMHGVNICSDFITLSYDAATGATRWEVRYTSEQWIHWFPKVQIAPDGSRVYVSGQARHFEAEGLPRYTTISYDAADGSMKWIARHGADFSYWTGMTMSPDGGQLFVTGMSAPASANGQGGDQYDIDTVAYNT
jgi:hypothetical protein